jgi:hypothetical protein
MCHDGLAPLFHPIGECFSVARSSYTIVIVEVTGISNSFDAKLRFIDCHKSLDSFGVGSYKVKEDFKSPSCTLEV